MGLSMKWAVRAAPLCLWQLRLELERPVSNFHEGCGMTEVERIEADWGEVVLSRDGDRLAFTRHASEDGKDGVLMAEYDPGKQILRLFPRQGEGGGPEFRYRQIHEIQVDTSVSEWDPENPVELTARLEEPGLTQMPHGLGFLFGYGLGVPKPYHRLVQEVEEKTSCTVLRLDDSKVPRIAGDVFHLGVNQFRNFVWEVDNYGDRGSAVVSKLRDTAAANVVADALGLPRRPPSPGRLPIIKEMTKVVSGETDLDSDGRSELLKLAAHESRTAAADHPLELSKLRQELNLVTLDVLIEQFGKALNETPGNELKWQAFFKSNTFALQQLFSSPVAYIGKELHVRLPSMDGSGTRIVDFMLVNAISRSVHLVEIKTPATPLLGPRYRGSRTATVFPPHPKLSGAVAQLQAQMESARTDLPGILKNSTSESSIDPGIVIGALIVGTLSGLGPTQLESFLRYRAGLTGMEVITYDEVLDRLKTLRDMLSPLTADPARETAAGTGDTDVETTTSREH